ncbi:MAG: FecR domain-containing protein [Treponema sp.]|nr:FecR domain-containing protein [Treponema sp.]
MKKIYKLVLFSLIFSVFSSSLFAAEGIVTFVKGKVEVQRDSSWVILNVGDKVSQSEVISTGFQSEAKIKLMDSVLYLGPVTRVTLETLKATDSTDKVNVYLSAGVTRSKVNHTDNKRVNYTVHTAVAVASVRGTDWIIDCSGNVSCSEGGVAVALASDDSSRKSSETSESLEDSEELPKNEVIVAANQTVTVKENGPVETPKHTTAQQIDSVYTAVSSAASKESVSSSSGLSALASADTGSSSSAPASGSVVVEVSFE